MPTFKALAAVLVCTGLAAICPTPASSEPVSAAAPPSPEAVSVLRELISINTTDTPKGNVTAAAEAIQKRLLAAGFAPQDMTLAGPSPTKQNLVVRYRGKQGSTQSPVLFLAHLDVVQALPSDWSTDPFTLVEKDGYYYGRGTQDMKTQVAVLVTSLVRLRQERWQPNQDMIFAFTADEEGGKANGVSWLIQNRLPLIQAAFVLNADLGGVSLLNGTPVSVGLQATEKRYSDFEITATNPGGHSSLPRTDNAIYELTAALNRLAAYQFPFELNAVTRSWLEQTAEDYARHPQTAPLARTMQAALATPPDPQAVAQLTADLTLNATFRTTCIPTLLAAGHAKNALPQTAQANVNCRVLPGHPLEEVRQQLITVLDDPHLKVRFVASNGTVSDTAPERRSLAPQLPPRALMTPLQSVVSRTWPGLPILLTMSTGATDSIRTLEAGMPSYGFSGLPLEHNDDRAHGRDERVPVASYAQSLQFFYDFLNELGQQNLE